MDSHRRRAGLLRDPGDLHGIYMIVVKTFADLYCHRLLYGLHNSTDNLVHQFRILHQGRTFAVFHHFRNRTAHIDIQYGKGTLFDPFRHLAHDLRIGAEELQGHRLFVRMNFQQALCIPVIVVDCLGADHLHAEKARPLLPAEQTKWQVRHPCHRSQNISVFKFYISYL